MTDHAIGLILVSIGAVCLVAAWVTTYIGVWGVHSMQGELVLLASVARHRTSATALDVLTRST